MYAVIIQTEKYVDDDLDIYLEEGREYLLVESNYGTMAEACYLFPSPSPLYSGAYVFNSPQEAAQFMFAWEPFPWYIKPKSYRLVELEPVYETRIVDWKEKE